MFEQKLVLEDGTIFIGKSFGSERTVIGEIVLNTGMTGYQEIISDPAYCGQIVMMNYPLIGSNGINNGEFESLKPYLYGLILKGECDRPTAHKGQKNLSQFLKANNIPGISGIDTRKLANIIRKRGTMKAMITRDEESLDMLLERLRGVSLQSNFVKQTSVIRPYIIAGHGIRIVLVDFGVKNGILREFKNRGCHIIVVPFEYSAEDILNLNPDGVVYSNGPGNPKELPESISTLKKILGKIPILGICLGHQLLALACGADTKKMKIGHRGSNHVIMDLRTNKTFCTAQNHGYTVIETTIRDTDLEITQVSLSDKTVEALRHKFHPAFSVQYLPEGSPGPKDTVYIFDDFLKMITENQLSSTYSRL
ncbi:carbamoyl phosphate synthase small subunit [Bacillus cereus]|uniref:carbamoyl phosphate synthase small subunit n=1 Tax=Bacillus cereus TaxID=1396 RepID=UPI0012489A48|nr:carbamoyl phosphate synthase small subunit [Bacillus cereus]MCU5475470.1 carbamoyl phosphate synthase small subunit [Bacillus cereus]MCU5614905.1 carbamoyl phosphate synthase small subunit [Bacillus cereus]